MAESYATPISVGDPILDNTRPSQTLSDTSTTPSQAVDPTLLLADLPSARFVAGWVAASTVYLGSPLEEYLPGISVNDKTLQLDREDLEECPLMPNDWLRVRSLSPVDKWKFFLIYRSLAATFLEKYNAGDPDCIWLWEDLRKITNRIRRRELLWTQKKTANGSLDDCLFAQQVGQSTTNLVIPPDKKYDQLLSFRGKALPTSSEAFASYKRRSSNQPKTTKAPQEQALPVTENAQVPAQPVSRPNPVQSRPSLPTMSNFSSSIFNPQLNLPTLTTEFPPTSNLLPSSLAPNPISDCLQQVQRHDGRLLLPAPVGPSSYMVTPTARGIMGSIGQKRSGANNENFDSFVEQSNKRRRIEVSEVDAGSLRDVSNQENGRTEETIHNAETTHNADNHPDPQDSGSNADTDGSNTEAADDVDFVDDVEYYRDDGPGLGRYKCGHRAFQKLPNCIARICGHTSGCCSRGVTKARCQQMIAERKLKGNGPCRGTVRTKRYVAKHGRGRRTPAHTMTSAGPSTQTATPAQGNAPVSSALLQPSAPAQQPVGTLQVTAQPPASIQPANRNPSLSDVSAIFSTDEEAALWRDTEGQFQPDFSSNTAYGSHPIRSGTIINDSQPLQPWEYAGYPFLNSGFPPVDNGFPPLDDGLPPLDDGLTSIDDGSIPPDDVFMTASSIQNPYYHQQSSNSTFDDNAEGIFSYNGFPPANSLLDPQLSEQNGNYDTNDYKETDEAGSAPNEFDARFWKCRADNNGSNEEL